MRRIFPYYGGKESIVKWIIPLIPAHDLYCEPFFGGGSVFFHKAPSKKEVINDTHDLLINFYRQVQTNYPALKKEIDATLYARSACEKANEIIKNPTGYDNITKAWAVFTSLNLSFNGELGTSGFKFGRRVGTDDVKQFRGYKTNFTDAYVQRLEYAYIENKDALRVIKSRDCEWGFFYLDPPYYQADMGHYGHYTKEDFTKLLDALSTLKGKFLLSSYGCEILDTHAKKMGWYQTYKDKIICAKKTGRELVRREILTANYELYEIT